MTFLTFFDPQNKDIIKNITIFPRHFSAQIIIATNFWFLQKSSVASLPFQPSQKNPIQIGLPKIIGSTMREVESLVPTSPLLAPRLNKTVLGSQPLPSSPPMSWVPAMASTAASSCDPVNASPLTLESGGPKLVVVLFGRPKLL